MPDTVLVIERLSVSFGRALQPRIRAVHDVSMTVEEGESVGIVGESGSGKSTIGRAVLGLTRPSGGRVIYRGQDIWRMTRRRRRTASSGVQAIFQDPYGSLNPFRTVGDSILEPVRAAGMRLPDSRAYVAALLGRVGLDDSMAGRLPSALSGGQRQRVVIARALAADPALIVCDEPVSALDVSTQAQILNLLRDVQHSSKNAYMFVSHDLSVVRYFCDRIYVLYGGCVMETGDAVAVSDSPRHPYTVALLRSVPVADPARRTQTTHGGTTELRSVGAGDVGCPFVARCPFAESVCSAVRPGLYHAGRSVVSCHMYHSGSGHSRAVGTDAN